MSIKPHERAYLNIIRADKILEAQEVFNKSRITHEWKPFSPLRIVFTWKSSKCLWGRFGGGWQWAVGFEASRNAIIFNLLICSISISWYKKKETT